ncbi:MAG TPA: ABC transporter transmembrane domain-containing protein, partial [Candidatus Izemoplasmatales bacterium]|nr:ABC transporter transmembrane domain-containing protein [Candidatus Izemoplasmatales bacterium]
MSDQLLDEENYTSNKIDWSVWKKIFSLMKPLKLFVFLSIASMAFVAASDVIYPYISKYAIDNVITPNLGSGTVDMQGLKTLIMYYAIFMVVSAVMVFLFILFAGKVQIELAYNIRKKAFHHLQELPFSYYDRTRVGWIMARMTSDSRNLSDILSWGLIDLTWGVFVMIILIFVMFLINWKLALIAIAIIPFLAVISHYFRRYILKAHRSIRKVNSKITGLYNEGLTGAITTKTLVLEDSNFRDFDNLTSDMRKQSVRAAMIQGMYFPAVLFIISIMISIVYYFGGRMVSGDIITIGTLYLFTSYVWLFFDPINNIASVFARFQQAQASAERIVSLIETPVDITDTPEVVEKYGTLFEYNRENFESLIGNVEFKNVSFKYQVGEKVLTDFNLSVKAGESIALVGHTGAGKSTIINLLCRFYEPTGGEILIDGVDYRQRSLG